MFQRSLYLWNISFCLDFKAESVRRRRMSFWRMAQSTKWRLGNRLRYLKSISLNIWSVYIKKFRCVEIRQYGILEERTLHGIIFYILFDWASQYTFMPTIVIDFLLTGSFSIAALVYLEWPVEKESPFAKSILTIFPKLAPAR